MVMICWAITDWVVPDCHLYGDDLLGHDGEDLDVDAVELVEAGEGGGEPERGGEGQGETLTQCDADSVGKAITWNWRD